MYRRYSYISFIRPGCLSYNSFEIEQNSAVRLIEIFEDFHRLYVVKTVRLVEIFLNFYKQVV